MKGATLQWPGNPQSVQSKEGLNRHLTFGNTYRRILRGYRTLPEDKDISGENLLFKLCVVSLRVAFEDTENGRHERKTVMERIEGRPSEHKEIGITIKDVKETPLARSLRDILVKDVEPSGQPKSLMVEAGPDKRVPTEGATFEVIQPSDPRWSKDLPDAMPVEVIPPYPPKTAPLLEGSPLAWLVERGFELGIANPPPTDPVEPPFTFPES